MKECLNIFIFLDLSLQLFLSFFGHVHTPVFICLLSFIFGCTGSLLLHVGVLQRW